MPRVSAGVARVIAVLAALAALAVPAGAASSKPNIVLIMLDDLGFNDVSFRGSNQIPTPNIDALAFNGVILDQHYVLPTCTPSRTAILTGLYPIRTGMQGYPLKAGEPRGLPLGLRTLPERLSSLGYRTNLVGKWHQGFHHADYTPMRRGFHHHLGYWNGYISYFTHSVHMDDVPNALQEGRVGFDMHWDQRTAWELRGRYATHVFTERAEELIRDHDAADGPLYLQLAHLAPHAGLNGTELEVPDEALNDQRYAYIRSPGRRRLAGVMREADESVGRVVRALQARGMLNNTLIVLMADNGGETIGTHSNHGSNWPLRGQKFTVYQGGVRGAALVWSTQLARPGTLHPGLVHATDWLPTFYEAAGGNVSDLGDIDGVSQWGSLTRNSASPRSEVLVQVNQAAAIIQGDWKLVKGVQQLEKSGYLGESGRDAEVPAYDAGAVVSSSAGVALAAAAAPGTPPLTAAAVLRMRADASGGGGPGAPSGTCRAGGGDALALSCQPYCLFNLRDDPCEARDVRGLHTGLGDQLLERLAYWEALTVPQLNVPVDPASDPRQHNLTWVSWMDPQPNQDASSGTCSAWPDNVLLMSLVGATLATLAALGSLRVSSTSR